MSVRMSYFKSSVEARGYCGYSAYSRACTATEWEGNHLHLGTSVEPVSITLHLLRMTVKLLTEWCHQPRLMEHWLVQNRFADKQRGVVVERQLECHHRVPVAVFGLGVANSTDS